MGEASASSGLHPRVAISLSRWQHVGCTRRTMESVLARTSPPFELIYVDGHSPRRVQRYLHEQAARHRFTLIRSHAYLASSEAHNAALPHARTEYEGDCIIQEGGVRCM